MQLTKHVETFNLLNEIQVGFGQGYSCSDHFFTLHVLIKEILKKRKETLFCANFLYFSKIWHYGLWFKLSQKPFSCQAVTSYKSIKSCVFNYGDYGN